MAPHSSGSSAGHSQAFGCHAGSVDGALRCVIGDAPEPTCGEAAASLAGTSARNRGRSASRAAAIVLLTNPRHVLSHDERRAVRLVRDPLTDRAEGLEAVQAAVPDNDEICVGRRRDECRHGSSGRAPGGSRRSAPPAACRRPCHRVQRRATAPRRVARRDVGRRRTRPPTRGAIDAGDDPPGEVGAGIARDEHGARSLVYQLCRRRAEEDASETALAVAADGDECVLRTLDLTEQLIPRGAANDPSPGVREPLDVAARFLEIPLRLRALLLFVVVGRDGAGPFRRRARRRCRKRRGAPPDPRPAPTPAWPLPQPRASRRSRRGRWQRRSFHLQRSLPTARSIQGHSS